MPSHSDGRKKHPGHFEVVHGRPEAKSPLSGWGVMLSYTFIFLDSKPFWLALQFLVSEACPPHLDVLFGWQPISCSTWIPPCPLLHAPGHLDIEKGQQKNGKHLGPSGKSASAPNHQQVCKARCESTSWLCQNMLTSQLDWCVKRTKWFGEKNWT